MNAAVNANTNTSSFTAEELIKLQILKELLEIEDIKWGELPLEDVEATDVPVRDETSKL